MSMVFYMASVVLSLYAAYLFTFRTYNTDFKGNPTKRMVYQNLIYLLVWALAFVPIANIVVTVLAVIAGSMSVTSKDLYIDSWLFRKPKEKDNKEN